MPDEDGKEEFELKLMGVPKRPTVETAKLLKISPAEAIPPNRGGRFLVLGPGALVSIADIVSITAIPTGEWAGMLKKKNSREINACGHLTPKSRAVLRDGSVIISPRKIARIITELKGYCHGKAF